MAVTGSNTPPYSRHHVPLFKNQTMASPPTFIVFMRLCCFFPALIAAAGLRASRDISSPVFVLTGSVVIGSAALFHLELPKHASEYITGIMYASGLV